MFAEIAKELGGPKHGFRPAAPIGERAAWEALDPVLRKKLVEEAEHFIRYDCPVIRATDFMEFSRTGNRVHYETKLFARRTALDTLVLGECAENNGRFLDDIINLITAICEETAWQLPAHNSYVRDTPQLPFPDVTRPVVDLFAAETGAILAVTDYLLREALDAVSPAIHSMIADNLERRIFTPYQKEHFWWMGDGKSHMNNWTIWCTQNVLLAAFTQGIGDGRRKEIFDKACQSIDYFLAEYGEDGCCDEGAQYYRHAGLCLFGCMEILNGVTDNGFSRLYQHQKIWNIALYILNVHVDGIYYVNFSDCSPVAGRCNAREFLFGRRIGSTPLMQFAAADFKDSSDPLLLKEHNLYYRLLTVFTHEEMTAYDTSRPLCHPDLYYGSVGLFLARDSHLCLAVKAGDNDDSHNHNDTGSFTVYKDGRPIFIDAGVESYTKKTFSPERYQIWTMQSQYHNLPTFGGCAETGMQHNGEAYAAKDVSWSLAPDICQISLDIADAYPDTGVLSYRRSATLEKGKQIVIHDVYTGTSRPAVLSLMTYEEPCWDAASATLMLGGKEDTRGPDISSLASCMIQGAGTVCTETIPITDARLKGAWGHEIYRTLVTLEGDSLTLTIW